MKLSQTMKPALLIAAAALISVRKQHRKKQETI